MILKNKLWHVTHPTPFVQRTGYLKTYSLSRGVVLPF